MRERIQKVIADLEMIADAHEENSKVARDTIDSIRELAKATATHRAIAHLYRLLLDSETLSAEKGSESGV